MPFEKVTVALAVATLAAAAILGEAITYRYDARGRLVKVQHEGSINANVAVNYSYDKADNRTSVNVVSPNPPPQ